MSANEINGTSGDITPADIYCFPGGGLHYFESDKHGGASPRPSLRCG